LIESDAQQDESTSSCFSGKGRMDLLARRGDAVVKGEGWLNEAGGGFVFSSPSQSHPSPRREAVGIHAGKGGQRPKMRLDAQYQRLGRRPVASVSGRQQFLKNSQFSVRFRVLRAFCF
jgi:hypothetical protein